MRNLFCIAPVETLSTTVQVDIRGASCSRERWGHRGNGKRFLYAIIRFYNYRNKYVT